MRPQFHWHRFRGAGFPVVMPGMPKTKRFVWFGIYGVQIGNWFFGAIKGRPATAAEASDAPKDAAVQVSLTIQRRPDGGLRISSDTLPGLGLSHQNIDLVLADLGPAIRGLLEHRGEWPETP